MYLFHSMCLQLLQYLSIHKYFSFTVSEWIARKVNPYLRALSSLRVKPISQGKVETDTPASTKASDIVEAAMKSYNNRVVNRLMFSPVQLIDDSIPVIIAYVRMALEFITNTITKRMKITDEPACPFQFDMCIATGKGIDKTGDDVKHDEGDTESDDDDDEKGSKQPESEEETKGYIDYIGDIEPKLSKNDLTYAVAEDILAEPSEGGLIANRFLGRLFKQNEKPTFRKRLISMVDRREKFPAETATNDESPIWIYDPPKGIYSRDMPEQPASEWGISASCTCLLPPIEYINEKLKDRQFGAFQNSFR